MKLRKTLQSEEELLVTKERDKVCKASKRVSETREQTLQWQEQNRTHLACTEGLHFSAVHYWFAQLVFCSWMFQEHIPLLQ